MALAVKMHQLSPHPSLLSLANQNEDGLDTHVIFLSAIFLSNLIAGCHMTGSRFMDHVLWVSVSLS
jgi:hypothetical protein